MTDITPTPGQAAHPLDLPAMAAFAANYGLSGDQAARRWATAVKNVREHFRMVADAAIMASPTAEDYGAAQIKRLRAQAGAADAIIRDVLESLCRRERLPLKSATTPGEPARNYELADRLGVGHVFGLQPQSTADAEPKPAPDPDSQQRYIDQLHDLLRDILQSLPDTADEPEWRDRAGGLYVHDLDGQPYRAHTEDDL